MQATDQERIDNMYSDILKRLKGGRIYGVTVKENNIKHLVVAAYFAGMADKQRESTGKLFLP